MSQFRAAVLIGLTFSLLVRAEGRRKLWDLDLSRFANSRKDLAARVWGIRFSPDESKVAIGFGPRASSDSRPRRVVIVSVDQPQTPLRDFEMSTRGFTLIFEDSIVWAPSGKALVVTYPRPTMLRLATETPCSFPDNWEFGGFLSQDRMVIFRRSGLAKNSEIRILRADCSLADNWGFDGATAVLDTSPERDLLAVQHVLGPREKPVTELVDAGTHQIKQRWVSEFSTAGIVDVRLLFTDRGKLAAQDMCARDNKIRMWPVGTLRLAQRLPKTIKCSSWGAQLRALVANYWRLRITSSGAEGKAGTSSGRSLTQVFGSPGRDDA